MKIDDVKSGSIIKSKNSLPMKIKSIDFTKLGESIDKNNSYVELETVRGKGVIVHRTLSSVLNHWELVKSEEDDG